MNLPHFDLLISFLQLFLSKLSSSIFFYLSLYILILYINKNCLIALNNFHSNFDYQITHQPLNERYITNTLHIFKHYLHKHPVR